MPEARYVFFKPQAFSFVTDIRVSIQSTFLAFVRNRERFRYGQPSFDTLSLVLFYNVIRKKYNTDTVELLLYFNKVNGSIARPSLLISKWRVDSVTIPDEPTFPIISPLSTFSPFITLITKRCA